MTFLAFQIVQLNESETDPYFLQFFQSNTAICLIIHVFCKSCESEVVFVLICILAKQFHCRKTYKTHEPTLLYLHLKFRRKYRYGSCLFSCTDTEIRHWFRFPTPKPGFCHLLPPPHCVLNGFTRTFPVNQDVAVK